MISKVSDMFILDQCFIYYNLAKLAEMKKIDSELRQIGSPKKKSTIARREGAKPTALSADAPCYVKVRVIQDKQNQFIF